MLGTMRIFFSVCLIFTAPLLLSSCNKALHNVGRTAFVDQQIAIQGTSPDLELWQTNDLAIEYRLEDIGQAFIITGTILIKDRITIMYPVSDFLYIYVNLLDQNGVATSKYDICPIISRYNTAPNKIAFNKTLQKDEGTVSIAFSYWGNFRDMGVTRRRDAVEWEIFYNPFEKKGFEERH